MSEDRTEAASPRRLQKAREEGDVPVSREAVLLGSLGSGLLACAIQLHATSPLTWFAHALLRRSFDPEVTISALLAGCLPVAAAAFTGALATTLLQTGFLLRIAALKPDFSRASPLHGVKRIFSTETLIQTGKALAKLIVFGWALWRALDGVLPGLAGLAFRPMAALMPIMLDAAWRLIWPLLVVQAVMAGGDLALTHFRYGRRLRMSRQEQRDEHKDSDGDPHVKQRLRQLARARGRRRMMQAAARATVVVTNPTHYAVALYYQRGSRAAPRVVAKGADELAARIREVAAEKHIPVVANPPLARALYRVELDSEIPQEHFRAVAEIVAYVWRLNQSRRAGMGY